MQSTTDNKKVKQIFQTKKGFITCSKIMINEVARSRTRSKNAYFANNEEVWIVVFTAVFCLKLAEHNSIKLISYNNWSAQTVNSVLCEIQSNQICSPLKISQPINAE